MNYHLFLRLTSYLSSVLIIPILGSCTALPSQQLPELNMAQSKQESPSSKTNLRQIAQSITVRISHDNQSGSGILISKTGNTYQVLTNAHIARDENASYQIQTPDGQTYQAKVIRRGDSFEGKDLALLEFEATSDYTIAQFGSRQSLNKQQTVLAAGFPIDKKEMVFSEGKITLLPEQPLKGGYQIGYSNQIQQGMSGGPLLNEAGEVVGINGLGQAAVLDETYTFEDGSTPREEQRRAFREASWSVPLEVSSLAKIDPQLAAQQVNDIAEAVTVRINAEKGNGSGVIVAHQGNTYWVLTADHVVSKKGNYQVVTPDGKNHAVDYETVQSKEGIDVAVLQFSSPETYTVATLGDYHLGSFEERPLVFLSGFPGSNPEKRSFTAGTTVPQVANSQQVKNASSLSSGYGLVYSNFSQRGMSGGPVLDNWGRVIGINTASEAEFEITEAGEVTTINLGQSLGVPIRTFLGLAPEIGMKTEDLKVDTSPPSKLKESQVETIVEGLFTADPPSEGATAIEWLNYGNRLWRIDKNEEAIDAFERAIERQPEFAQAFYAKGKALEEQGVDLEIEEQNYQAAKEKFQQAVAAFAKATEINPNFYEAWRDRAKVLSSDLDKHQQALTAINQAIEINPEDFVLHYRRGEILYYGFNRHQEAEKAYSEAIALNPSAWMYLGRGLNRYQSQNYQGAIADFNKAIELQPKFAGAYSVRGAARVAIGKKKGALADANKAIELQPNYAPNYLTRGATHFGLGNYQEAIADSTKVLELDFFDQGTIYNAYVIRAEAHTQLKDYELAIKDYTQAIKLQPDKASAYSGRGNLYTKQKNYQQAINDYTKVIELQPNNAQAYVNRGSAYAQLREQQKAATDYQQAQQLFTQTIESDPDNARAYFGRANVRLQLGNRQQAIQDLEKASQFFRENGNERGYQLVQQLLSRLSGKNN